MFRSRAARARWEKVGIALVIFAALVVPAVYLVTNVISKYSDYPHADLSSQDPSMTVTCAPGKECAFRVIGLSLEGGWRVTDALTIAFAASGQDRSYEVHAAGDGTGWGSQVSRHHKDYRIPASFRFPSDVAAGQTITGRLTGAVQTPQESSSGVGFVNHSEQLDIPVTIKVVPAADFEPPTFPHGYWLFGVNWWMAIIIFVVGWSLQSQMAHPYVRPQKDRDLHEARR